MAAVRGRSSGLPGFLKVTGSPTHVQRPPFLFGDKNGWLNPTLRDFLMTNSPYIPLTAIDCTIPALLIDRNVPLDVLHANAVARVLAVTQLMESFSSREVQQADSVDLKHLATVSAQLLRDGCDLLDVLGWRLRPA